MKLIIKTISLFVGLLISSSVFALQGLNVITITTDDPQGYVKWLTDAQPIFQKAQGCLLYTSPSPRDGLLSRMPSSA